MPALEVQIELEGRESLHLNMDVDSDLSSAELKQNPEQKQKSVIRSASLSVIGGPELLQLAVEWRPKLQGVLGDVPLPKGTSTAAILLREVLLKAQGRWEYPYAHEELCHCRVVQTQTVDRAIVTGAHTPEEVSRQTSASTACGTCRPDVEKILKFRLESC